MSDKTKGLPLLRKTPVDFLSRDEARQALNPDVALDASEAARALRSEPNNENILLDIPIAGAGVKDFTVVSGWPAELRKKP